MTRDVTPLIHDLGDEQDATEALIAPLDEKGWQTPTPAEGWDVRDTVGHLCYFDENATLALVDPKAFSGHAGDLIAGRLGRPDEEMARSMPGPDLLSRWRASRAALLEALREAHRSLREHPEPRAVRVPWYGLDMSLASFITARLMETWAHGQDLVDALGAAPVVSHRLRHVCHIGIGARAYSFAAHGLVDPGDPIRVEVTGPDGDTWTWGPPDATERVTGAALDLALVVTRRRHLDDTALSVTGATARQWISIAQSFAGPPGPDRKPGRGGHEP